MRSVRTGEKPKFGQVWHWSTGEATAIGRPLMALAPHDRQGSRWTFIPVGPAPGNTMPKIVEPIEGMFWIDWISEQGMGWYTDEP